MFPASARCASTGKLVLWWVWWVWWVLGLGHSCMLELIIVLDKVGTVR